MEELTRSVTETSTIPTYRCLKVVGPQIQFKTLLNIPIYLSTTALQGRIQEFLIGVGPHPPHPLPPFAVARYNFDDVSFKKSASLKVIYYPADVSISVSNKRQASGLITVGGGGGGLLATGLGYLLLSLIISVLFLIKNLHYASSTGHLLPLFCCPSLAH